VKALGVQLGRFVLVFCCDETFDFQAMGRIFVGLCQVGAWGCFDEFNRLEERILSAVSQQVQSIQQGLASLVKNPNTEIELVGKNLKINPNIGLFPSFFLSLWYVQRFAFQVFSSPPIPITRVDPHCHPI
jgi:dynein cytoplasmic 1 heavy chain